LDFACEVAVHHKQLFGRPKAKGNILRVTFAEAIKKLLLVTREDFLRGKQLVAVVIKKQEIPRVKRLLNGFVSAVPPVDAVVNIGWPRGVFAHLDQLFVHGFFPPLLA
jgi:hypothetical protein